MMESLYKLYLKLKGYIIPFIVLEGNPAENITFLYSIMNAGLLVTDFNPLKISRVWKMRAAQKINIRFVVVDAHNVIPCLAASDKQEFAAYTFRPKVNKKLNDFLTDFPDIVNHPFQLVVYPPEWSAFNEKTQKILENSHNGCLIKSGEDAAKEQHRDFIARRLKNYNDRNVNNPNKCLNI